jgi:hypothetical protein
MSMSPLRANSRASCKAGRVSNRTRHLLGENLLAPYFGQRIALHRSLDTNSPYKSVANLVTKLTNRLPNRRKYYAGCIKGTKGQHYLYDKKV